MAQPRPTTPRIAPLAPGEGDAQTAELLAQLDPNVGASNIFTTLVRHPGLFRKWSPFGGKLLTGKLPARDRELLILRTGWRTQAEYEWGQHVRIALNSDITEAEVERVKAGPDDPAWDPFDAALLRATDELHDDGCITDATWATLADRYTTQQLIEVPMVVGQYHLVGFTLNSLGVQREAGVVGFDG